MSRSQPDHAGILLVVAGQRALRSRLTPACPQAQRATKDMGHRAFPSGTSSSPLGGSRNSPQDPTRRRLIPDAYGPAGYGGGSQAVSP